jgi:GNAT superfamily N-acetyltransferase
MIESGEAGRGFRALSLAQRPELAEPALEVLALGWPEFMRHDPAAERYQPRLANELAAFQVLVVDDKDELAAVGVSIPFAWDGTVAGLPAGWDAVVEQGIGELDQGRPPTAVSALSVTVAPDRLGQGLSRLVIAGLKQAAADAGLGALVVPARPTAKSAYPLIPMERYIRWTLPDGAPFDPWLRTHWRLGGRMLGVCRASMEITADVATWEAWTGMRLPETGSYVVPNALVPVEIDRARDLGRYVEPNVWVQHPIRSRRTVRNPADLPKHRV